MSHNLGDLAKQGMPSKQGMHSMTTLSPHFAASWLLSTHPSQPAARPHLRCEAAHLNVATHGQAKRAAVHGGGTHGRPGFKDGQADLRPLGESTTISSQARARVVACSLEVGRQP